MFFDSHTHLNCEAYSDRERRAVINTIENSKVDYAVDVGTDLGSSFLTVGSTGTTGTRWASCASVEA